MHAYHTDEEIRTRVFTVSGILAIVAARLFHLLTQQLPLDIPWWVDTPSVLAFFGIFVWLYDNHFWKCWPFRRLPWFYIPNLNGLWKVEVKSSYTGFNEDIQASGLIRQTASKICIALQTDQSSSHSIFAALVRTDRFSTFELMYYYLNRPKADSIETMGVHYGTSWVRISEGAARLEGDYYSGRGRQNYGTITFLRVENRKSKSCETA
jgi:hypothetical protein